MNDDPFRKPFGRKPYLDSGLDTLKVLLLAFLFLLLVSGLIYRW